ncbi:3,4-dihydroxy 2-butanone 4-phosphate synthase [Methanohalophilus levihalophilus]|uniref:3,4-dihydroxy-2-butanone-4-phosphate synthase n=1 Tax=Methanohalophilus levihalophilus TaxID=1431282 RepID=UPI001AE6FD48|nr:3,4-dihydroxy-2-butanone-4-phosphate synthase [Methanohalophilus levihalophilus]MBP2029907.1 3,4-dihydroxy 2-butanone 4-phosphate synthase [Methanohalophilus levihalophilus]
MEDSVFSPSIRKGIEAVREGKMIFIFDSDSREGETDFTIPAAAVTADDVRWMRVDGGGLICVALADDVCEKLGLPFMADVLHDVESEWPAIKSIAEKAGDLKYDNRSSFSLWVNHRDTRTGIPDRERALTINKLAEISEITRNSNPGNVDFGAEFRAPGHVALLRAAPGLMENRSGQTELSIAMAEIAGISPAMVVCEMLDDSTGKALTKEDAKKYAEMHDCVFLGGAEITEAYELWKSSSA